MELPVKTDLVEEISGPTESGYHFIQDFLRCEQYWAYTYYYGLEQMNPATVLLYGLAMHEGMEAWYMAVMNRLPLHERVRAARTMFKATLAGYKDMYLQPEYYSQDMAKGIALMEQYGFEYANEGFTVDKLPDGRPAIEVACSTHLPSGDKFTGRLDLVVLNSVGVRYIVDHKTTGWSLMNLERALRVSHQATGYLWLWNNNFPDKQAAGVVFNVLRSYNGKPSFGRPIVYKTAEDVSKFQRDVAKILDRIANTVAEPDPTFIMNTDSCYKYNKACPFLELCQGSNYELLLGKRYKLRGDTTDYGNSKESIS